MANSLVAIGYLGGFRVYLNVPRDKAIERYKEEEGVDPISEDYTIDEIVFDDVFYAYEVGPIEDPILS